MTCPPPQALAAWRSGTLPGPERATIDAHLAGCATCAAALERPLADEAPTSPAGVGAAEPIRPGQGIGRYVVLWELGRGGMGAVYAAFDPQLDRKVALKLLLSEADRAAGSDPALAQARLLREAQALARVSHPHTVAVFDVGTHQGQVFLAMEHLDGATLRGWVKAQPRTWREVVAAVAQAGEGLAAVHAAGLVHRDFKPGNVIITTGGQAKVLDFGLARLAHVSRPRAEADDAESGASDEPASDRLGEALTQVGSVCGTPGYLAPELLVGGAPTPLSDQFAFGVTLYQGLYGQRPFGRAGSARDLPLIQAGIGAAPPAGSDVPAWVHAIVRRCLAPNPAERFPDLRAALAALALDPSRKRRERRRWALGAVALVAALATTWVVRAGPTCPTAAEFEARAFSPSQRASLTTKLGPEGLRVLGQLDQTVRDWALQSHEACLQAAEVPPPPLALLRRDCLERRGMGVATVLEALGMVQGAVDRHATELFNTVLGDVACASPEQYGRKTADEVPEAQRPLARQLRADLLRTSALSATGREAEALTLAQQTLARATDAGVIGFQAEALHQVAAQALVQGREEEALVHYRTAFGLFLEAGIDDRALQTGVKLVEQGMNLADHLDAAGMVVTVCEALWRRQGRTRALEYTLLAAQVAMATAAGDEVTRVALSERRVALAIEQYGESSRPTAEARSTLAAAMWVQGDIARSNHLDQAALATLTRVLGPRDPSLLPYYSAVGTGLVHEGRRAEGLEALEQGRALAASLGDETSALAVDLDVALADALVGHDDARALHLSAGALAFYEDKQSPADLAGALFSHAAALASLGRGAEALADCGRLSQLAPSLADPSGSWKLDLLHCEAEARTALGQSAAALALYEAAAALPPGKIPDEEGRKRFNHARAVRAAHGDAAHAEALARQALADYSVFPGFEEERKRIEAFLAPR